MHRQVIEQRDEGRAGTVEGTNFATFEYNMFKKSSQTKDSVQSPITPGIKVVEINMCLITPPPKGHNFATPNIE